MTAPEALPKPVCFMVMPFRTKKVGESRGPGAPLEVDCDALWDRAFRPALEDLGYEPIRGDYDPSSVIIKEMLERLAWADLVLADVSLPNANVYYEVGLRHVAKETHCVLLAADWSRQMFDIEQFTAIRYPLADGGVPEQAAQAIRELLATRIPHLASTRTPYHELIIAGAETEAKRRGVFRDFVGRLSGFQATVREIRMIQDKETRKQRVLRLQEASQGSALQIPELATELVSLVRDCVGWNATVELIDSFPGQTRELPFVQEQRLLALANRGQELEAIARLEELVARYGDSPERQGLIGGRYKRLWKKEAAARAASDPTATKPSVLERRYLDRAIEHYQLGMTLDLNQYYCSCNLPALLRARGKDGDAARARVIDHFVVEQCTRALERGEGDEWLRPTLLGAAFRAGDVKEAEKLADRIELEGGAAWQLESTLADLATAVDQQPDESIRHALSGVLDQLHQVLRESKG